MIALLHGHSWEIRGASFFAALAQFAFGLWMLNERAFTASTYQYMGLIAGPEVWGIVITVVAAGCVVLETVRWGTSALVGFLGLKTFLWILITTCVGMAMPANPALPIYGLLALASGMNLLNTVSRMAAMRMEDLKES